MERKVVATIREGLGHSTDWLRLAKNKDFIDSVLYRFAMMRLPLRPGEWRGAITIPQRTLWCPRSRR